MFSEEKFYVHLDFRGGSRALHNAITRETLLQGNRSNVQSWRIRFNMKSRARAVILCSVISFFVAPRRVIQLENNSNDHNNGISF